jgi:hypothetical protein
LKRTVLRKFTQPLAAMVEAGTVPPQARVRAELSSDGESLQLMVEEG